MANIYFSSGSFRFVSSSIKKGECKKSKSISINMLRTRYNTVVRAIPETTPFDILQTCLSSFKLCFDTEQEVYGTR
jgi:hypothetical protein